MQSLAAVVLVVDFSQHFYWLRLHLHADDKQLLGCVISSATLGLWCPAPQNHFNPFIASCSKLLLL